MVSKSLLTAFLIIGLTTAAFAADMRLIEAAKNGDVDGVRVLLKQKPNVNEAEGDGMTALHWAVYANNFDVAQVLVQSGASVKAQTRLDSSTPLLMASINGNVPMMELLIK